LFLKHLINFGVDITHNTCKGSTRF